MSIRSPMILLAMAEHSMCQPARQYQNAAADTSSLRLCTFSVPTVHTTLDAVMSGGAAALHCRGFPQAAVLATGAHRHNWLSLQVAVRNIVERE